MSSKRSVLAAGKYLRLVTNEGYEMVERINCAGVAAVIAITENRELVLVEQFRKPLEVSVIEIPAGLVSDTEAAKAESVEEAAMRELEEETGFAAGALEFVAEWPTSSGMTSETVAVFRARDLKRVGRGGGDASEKITVHVIPMDSVAAWLKKKSAQGCMIDPKVLAALYLCGGALAFS